MAYFGALVAIFFKEIKNSELDITDLLKVKMLF